MISRVLGLALMIFILHISSLAIGQIDKKQEAREHFQKGVTAFGEKRFADAVTEFESAHRLSPAFAVLYNIGQVNVSLGRAVEAIAAFRDYLKQGASAIPRARRQQVEAEIERQLTHVGSISVVTKPEGAEIRVDGKSVGTTPFAEILLLSAGRHSVEAVLSGHATEFRDLSVAGGKKADLLVELSSLPVLVTLPAAEPPAGLTTAPATRSPPVSAALGVSRPAVPPAPSKGSTGWSRIPGYVLLAGGVIAAAAGGFLAYSGAANAEAARERLAMAKTGTEWDMSKPAYDAGKTRNLHGWQLVGVGAAALLGGTLWIALTPGKGEGLALAPTHTSGTTGLALGGNWSW